MSRDRQPSTGMLPLGLLSLPQRAILVTSAGLVAASGGLVAAGATAVARFVVAGLALAALAALVGEAIDQVGQRLGPGPTGLIQSTLGNLPELFVGLFALREGLTGVVRSALVGSVLGNAVLVLGMAFVAGGLRHGTQKFDAEGPRLHASLLLLVVAALLVPTLAVRLGTPASAHAGALSNDLAVILLVVYALSVPYFLRLSPAGAAGDTTAGPAGAPAAPTGAPTGHPAAPTAAPAASHPAAPTGAPSAPAPSWPLALALTVLGAGAAGAAVAAEWFVAPLQDATRSLGLSQTFTGLVIVAIASNAVENAVGVRFAWKAKPAYAISTTLNSPLQVALLLTPVLVLVSHVVGPAKLTLVFPPLLVAALAISATVVTVVIYDGEYTWIEGVALMALYLILVAAFWWG